MEIFLRNYSAAARADSADTATNSRRAAASAKARPQVAPVQLPEIALADRMNTNGTHLPNPDGTTSGHRPDGELFMVHPLHLPISGAVLEEFFDEEATEWLPHPIPPADLPDDAYEYAERWCTLWERALLPQFEFFDTVDSRDVVTAQEVLANWRTHLQAVDAEAAAFGDYNGARNLILGNGDMFEVVDHYLDLCREYMVKDFDWESLSFEEMFEICTELVGNLIDFYAKRHSIVAAFYQDPSGAAAREAEEAAFAPMMAMRSNIDESAPELQPIAGVSLHDYVAGAAKLQAGLSVEDVAKLLGIERPQWDQAAAEWQQRIGTHPMTVGMQYTTLMSTPHPLLDAAPSAPSPGGYNPGASDNNHRLTTDRDFYIEVAAAMNAATEAGIDAGGYIEEHYQCTLAAAGSAGVTWMSDYTQAGTLMTLIQAKQAEIAKTLTAGTGVADDIVF